MGCKCAAIMIVFRQNWPLFLNDEWSFTLVEYGRIKGLGFESIAPHRGTKLEPTRCWGIGFRP